MTSDTHHDLCVNEPSSHRMSKNAVDFNSFLLLKAAKECHTWAYDSTLLHEMQTKNASEKKEQRHDIGVYKIIYMNPRYTFPYTNSQLSEQPY